MQLYELVGNLAIAGLLLRLHDRLGEGRLFLAYLLLFGVLRFLIFFVRGDVPRVAWELKNGHWTALALIAVTVAIFLIHGRRHARSATYET